MTNRIIPLSEAGGVRWFVKTAGVQVESSAESLLYFGIQGKFDYGKCHQRRDVCGRKLSDSQLENEAEVHVD